MMVGSVLTARYSRAFGKVVWSCDGMAVGGYQLLDRPTDRKRVLELLAYR